MIIKKGKGARMTTLNLIRIVKSVTYTILGLTDSNGSNGCAIPELVTGKNNSVKKHIGSRQTILVDFIKKEVL
jgi:hypothetical protein